MMSRKLIRARDVTDILGVAYESEMFSNDKKYFRTVISF